MIADAGRDGKADAGGNGCATEGVECQPVRVNSTDKAAICAAAARNNAGWCASVCRSHGIDGTFGETAWWSSLRTPPFYPDAITLRRDAVPADFLTEIDTTLPGCSVKDSFAALDLTSSGFVELFAAQWIHRQAGLQAPQAPTRRSARVATAVQLRDWQAAWHGGDETQDVFRPALLDDPSVLVLTVYDGEDRCGGVILNRGAGLVGLSNLFAVGSGDAAAIWSAAITAAAGHFPGLPLVGYEHADDLVPALASGFVPVGALRIWLHGS
jgi:hypothetical protein